MQKKLSSLNRILHAKDRICILSTVDADQQPNAAIFGAVKESEGRILLATGNNRTKANLAAQPAAMLIVFIPAEAPHLYRGMRLKLRFDQLIETGSILDSFVQNVAEHAGQSAADSIRCVLSFHILSISPLASLPTLDPSAVTS